MVVEKTGNFTETQQRFIFNYLSEEDLFSLDEAGLSEDYILPWAIATALVVKKTGLAEKLERTYQIVDEEDFRKFDMKCFLEEKLLLKHNGLHKNETETLRYAAASDDLRKWRLCFILYNKNNPQKVRRIER